MTVRYQPSTIIRIDRTGLIGRVLGTGRPVGADESVTRLRVPDGIGDVDLAHEPHTVVSRPGTRGHELQLALCEFREWSHDWDRVQREERDSRRSWDDLYDTGIDLLRDFARAAGLILDSDTEPGRWPPPIVT